MKQETVDKAREMLDMVLRDRATYSEVAARFGIGKSTVQRQIRGLVERMVASGKLTGSFTRHPISFDDLHDNKDAILASLREVEVDPINPRQAFPSREALNLGLERIEALSETPARDAALALVLFSTGLKPAELARLLVKDYLAPSGEVRPVAELCGRRSASGRPRPVFFVTERANLALDRYLGVRLGLLQGVSRRLEYRGLNPDSALFLNTNGLAFDTADVQSAADLSSDGAEQIMGEALKRVFALAMWVGMTTSAARRQLATAMARRGAVVTEIAHMLGAEDRVVRRLLEGGDWTRPPLRAFVQNLL